MSAPAEALDGALAVCLGELDRRELTVAQMRGRLERAGTPEATVEAALDWLIERRQLDDAGYAERFTDDRRRLDGWGAERIRRRLEAAGVDGELIEAALGGREPEEELEAALGILAARVKGGQGGEGEHRRALGLLVRRGYELELAEQAVRRHFRPDTS
ncbi:MAG: regulatory protein [Solirubrobacteraceae bacterium]|nr:regulatory protein [Solirubrobacteraceae bacterium]